MRYMIGLLPKGLNKALNDIIIGSINEQRIQSSENKIVIMFEGELPHPALNGFKEYSHTDILEELKKEEWL